MINIFLFDTWNVVDLFYRKTDALSYLIIQSVIPQSHRPLFVNALYDNINDISHHPSKAPAR